MVSKSAMGMETVVSAGVANVSSGQRQLILFTAAVASEAPIILLDEALAHMDLDMRAHLGAHALRAAPVRDVTTFQTRSAFRYRAAQWHRDEVPSADMRRGAYDQRL